MTSQLAKRFEKYAEFHRHPTNRLLHKIGVPLVVFHVIAMVDWIRLSGNISVAVIGYFILIAWYLSLDLKLGLLMAIFYGACFPLARVTPAWIVWLVAVAAWSIQLLGHAAWERRSPALVTNFVDALIAPLFFVHTSFSKH